MCTLGTISIVLVGLQRSPFEPLDSVELKFLSLKTAILTALTSIKRVGDLQALFGKRRVPCVRAGLLSRCLETPAWIRAQGSHHALPRSVGEPASTALGGGRSSLSVAVSRKSIAHIRDPHLERQKLRAALCLPRRAAEREGCLQTEEEGRLQPLAWHLSVTHSLVNICMPQGCDEVQLVALSIGPLCRHDITRSDRQIGNV